MTKPRSDLKNVPTSVHARLLTFAKRENRDFNQVLTQYFQERLLDRLARSRYDEQFVLKGALLFVALDSERSAARGRPTRDIDFEGLKLRPEPEHIRAIFSEIAALPSDPDDGVVFLIKDIEAEQIVEHDVGFGDAITPEPQRTAFPTLLDEHVWPKLLTYPLETVVAEKFEAAIDLAEANSRMKDFRDLSSLRPRRPSMERCSPRRWGAPSDIAEHRWMQDPRS